MTNCNSIFILSSLQKRWRYNNPFSCYVHTRWLVWIYRKRLGEMSSWTKESRRLKPLQITHFTYLRKMLFLIEHVEAGSFFFFIPLLITPPPTSLISWYPYYPYHNASEILMSDFYRAHRYVEVEFSFSFLFYYSWGCLCVIVDNLLHLEFENGILFILYIAFWQIYPLVVNFFLEIYSINKILQRIWMTSCGPKNHDTHYY